MKSILKSALIFSLLAAFFATKADAFTLPENFTDTPVIENLVDPDGFAFSPNGRMFISERISGKLRVAEYDGNTDGWTLNSTPFHTFNTPNENGVPTAVRSAGLRDIAFDPNFNNNGYIYAFYMDDATLHNRVVRIQADNGDANASISSGAQLTLIELPFNNTSSSGSHNGGALEFGNDGKLYITTGDGWEGVSAGDPVQNLGTFTGKVFRINSDGSIPTDNPFYSQTSGSYRAIYALGLRNPYSMSKHADTGVLYINEARGNNKASIYIVSAGANYQHEGTGIGTTTNQWADASGAGGELITGGAWMPDAGLGNFPALYNGHYFTALWGSNSFNTGRINTITSDSNTASEPFATGLGIVGSNNISAKPVVTRFNENDGYLYYMLTTYTTNSGQIRRVRYTFQQTVATPTLSPNGDSSENPIQVTIDTDPSDADIYYSLNNTAPTNASTLYNGAISIAASAILRAKAFKAGFNDSSEASAVYIIGDTSTNLPPDVDAGEDKVGFLGTSISLDGSGTTDPDGNDDFLTGEQWTQLSGPNIDILDATEEIAFFIPTEEGDYEFELEVSDGIEPATDNVIITVIKAPRVTSGLQVLYTFEEDSGTIVADVSGVGSPLDLTISNESNVVWLDYDVDGDGNSDRGIDINATVTISSGVSASKIITACQASNAISIEAWLKPVNDTQSGPARIISLSADTLNRNFTLGQETDQYDTRLRTTNTGVNGTPSLAVPASTVKVELQHVIYTRKDNGEAIIFINGVPQVVGIVDGNLSNWNSAYHLLLANEDTDDRGWLGEMYLAAVYCDALTQEQVSQNYSAGLAPFTQAPDTDEDGIIDMLDNCPDDANFDQANLDGDSMGDACDEDIDNDGAFNQADGDLDEYNNAICQDSDADMCDDCTIGVDGFGPLSDIVPSNDGQDNENDGLCDLGDTDDDNDDIPDSGDNCPLISNFDQLDSNDNGIGDVCDSSEDFCFAIAAQNGKVVTICL